MKASDQKQAVLIGESFSRWYRAEIAAYVTQTDNELDASVIARNVSQLVLGALIRELAEAGVTLEMIIAFLRVRQMDYPGLGGTCFR
jgi:hypothetical protein